MKYQHTTRLASAAGSAVLAGATAVAAAETKVDSAAVDKAFEALKTYDWGADRNTLNPIDDAVIATRGDAGARQDLETRLIEVVQSDASRSAKDFACRKLRTVGTAASVPALAALLRDKDLSHMARYALERIPAAEAAAALRDALPKVTGDLKIGVIGSLGARRDADSVAPLAGALGDADKEVAAKAAQSLGRIGNAPAGKALGEEMKKAPGDLKPAITDACLVCADQLLADGNKAEAIVLYNSLKGEDQPKLVRVAATRGLLMAAGKKE